MSDRPSSPIPNLRDLSMEELRELSGHQHHLYGLGHVRDFLQEPASDSPLFRDLTVRKSSTPQNSQGDGRPVKRYGSAFTVEYATVQPSETLEQATKVAQEEHLAALLARESRLIPPSSMSLSDLWRGVDLMEEIERPAIPVPRSLTCGFPMMVTAPGSYYMFELGGGRQAYIPEEEIHKLERSIKQRERRERRLILRQMKLHPRASRRSQIRKGRA